MTSIFLSRYMSSSDDIPINIHGWLRIHKDGRCERLVGIDTIHAGTDPLSGVKCKDVVISSESKLSVRIYIPKVISGNHKLPTLIYYHGGGFLTESAVSSTYHPMLNLLTAETNVIAVSVSYRLAPEYPIPIAYDDSWEAVKWVFSHARGDGYETWLNDYADLHNVYFCGDSAGANIAHNMAIRVGLEPNKIIRLNGLILLHPFFGGKDIIGYESSKYRENKAFSDYLWMLASPSGLDDPLFNPAMDPNISGLGCSKILVCVGEKDSLKERGLKYIQVMKNSGWKGKIEVMESKGVGHVFFLHNTSSEKASTLRIKIGAFINSIHSRV